MSRPTSRAPGAEGCTTLLRKTGRDGEEARVNVVEG
jgi:hypothetical protein